MSYPFKSGLTKDQIRERIRIANQWITTSRTDIFSSAVHEGKFRFIIQIRLTGDQSAARTVDIEKKEEDSTYTSKFSNIPVAQTGNVEIPTDYDVEQPVLVLHGGSNLTMKVSGNSLQAMVSYWDDEI